MGGGDEAVYRHSANDLVNLEAAVRYVFGLAAVACGVTGAALEWGAGVALMVAAGFLLLLDRSV
jgi:hypothetical protein